MSKKLNKFEKLKIESISAYKRNKENNKQRKPGNKIKIVKMPRIKSQAVLNIKPDFSRTKRIEANKIKEFKIEKEHNYRQPENRLRK